MKLTYLILLTIASTTLSCQNQQKSDNQNIENQVFVSPLGKELISSEPSKKMLDKYAKAKQDFEADPSNVDNIIWYGRRTAYLGRYEDAINIYSKGIDQFPEDPRLYRHRGHRFISIRQFDEAIADFEIAGRLIEGTENEIEPDGMPNAQNIPVSTLHGNIWYHLGLVYYLTHDYEKAYDAYVKCRESGSKPDNIVSSTHWLYMIQRRMGNEELANRMLEPIEEGVIIIENTDYYNLCRFYKGLIPVDSLQVTGEDSPSSDAIKYGLANWYFYNGEKDQSRKMLEDIVDGKSWTSFGYIAAERDILKYFSTN
jgi:tetratricopeptide (TPR) repeat protein